MNVKRLLALLLCLMMLVSLMPTAAFADEDIADEEPAAAENDTEGSGDIAAEDEGIAVPDDDDDEGITVPDDGDEGIAEPDDDDEGIADPDDGDEGIAVPDDDGDDGEGGGDDGEGGDEEITASGKCGDDLTWTLSGGCLTIDGTGSMYDYGYSSPEWADYRDEITSVVIGADVTAIGEGAFFACSSLTSIDIPAGISAIGEDAFESCSALTAINTAADNAVFSSADGVLFNKDMTTLIRYPEGKTDSRYDVPAGVTAIGSEAFVNTAALNRVRIPGTVTTVGSYAFECSALAAAGFEGSAPVIESGAFSSVTATVYVPADDGSWTDSVKQDYEGTLTWKTGELPYGSGSCGDALTWILTYEGVMTISGTGGMTSWTGASDVAWADCRAKIGSVVIEPGCSGIGAWAFARCSALTDISIPGSVTSIGEWAFYYCSSLGSIALPSGVTEIGEGAFYWCFALKSAEIPSGVTEIADSLFYSCSALESVELPSGITSIGESAFSGCSALTDMTIPSGVTSIGRAAFQSCSSVPGFTIPSGVTEISEYTFAGCSGITEMSIPGGVTKIGVCAFQGCDFMTSISIPATVTSIGDYALSFCVALTAVSIPDSVETLGDYQFMGDELLTDVKLPNGISYIGYDDFLGCYALESIYIPDGVEQIRSRAFYECKLLKSVRIPDSVTIIYEEVFYKCPEISYVFYSGTESEWKDVTVEFSNTKLTSAVFHYSANDHTAETDAAVAATCVSTGLTEGSHCPVCGLVLTAQQETPLAAHTLTHVAAKAAGLSTEGNVEYWVCSVCGRYFLDEDCTEETTAEAVVTPKTGLDAPVITGAYNYAGYIKVVWNAVDGAEKYRLLSRKGAGDWVTVCDTTSTRVNITDVEDGASYTFMVVCISADGSAVTSGYSNRASQIRLTTPTVTVTRFGKAGTVDGSGFKVSWDATTGGSCYKIYYREQGGGWALYATYAKSNNTRYCNIKASQTNAETTAGAKFPDLLIGHTYEFVVLTATSQAGITSGFPTTYTGYKF